MLNKTSFKWDVKRENGSVLVYLNGSINRLLDPNDPNYKNDVDDLKSEIDYYSSDNISEVTGLEIL